MTSPVFAAARRIADALRVPLDKVMHIGLGLLWLCATTTNLMVYSFFGPGPALAYGTTAYGILYEVNQCIRKEGQPDFWDAFCTALPGWMAWAILEAWRAMQ